MNKTPNGPFAAPRASHALAIACFALLIPLQPSFASAQTNVGVEQFVQSYDPMSFGRRLTFALNFFAGSPTQEACAATDAENVVLTDQLPPGVTFASESHGGGVYNRDTNTVTWNLGTVNRCATFGNQFGMTVDVSPSVPDGATPTNTLSITTTTPETTTADNTQSVNSQVGFLPLRVSITDFDASCDASASGVSNDRRESRDGSMVPCSVVGDGGAESGGLTDTLFINPSVPGVPGSGVPGPVGQIGGPSDRVTIRGVGVQGTASGRFVGGAINPQGTSADAEATVDVDIEIFNPNPYAVPVHLSRDVSLYAAAGNESARPPFPGSASVEDTGGTADAGSGVATFRIDQHVDLSPTECRIRRVEASTLFPIPSGPDPALDPVQSGTFSETDQTFSPGSCFGGPNVSANSSKTLRLVFGSTFASGSTSVTFFDGSIILVRSGYGLFNASASLEIMRADGSASAGTRVLAVRGDSPIDLMVTDPNGKKLGFDLGNKRVVNEIFGGQYNGHGAEPQLAQILRPVAGDYHIDVLGIGDGPFTVTVEMVDADGNVVSTQAMTGVAAPGSVQTFQASVGGAADTIPPTTTATPSAAPNAHGWNNTDVTINLSAVDNAGGSGVKEIDFSLSGAQGGAGAMAGSNAAVTISAEGTTTLTFFASDNAGNQEPAKTLTVRVDKTPPVITGLPVRCTLWPPDHRLVQVGTVTASDRLSGLVPGSLALAGTSNEPEAGDTAPDVVIASTTVQLRAARSGAGAGRVYTLTATASDLAGNRATVVGTCTVPHDQR